MDSNTSPPFGAACVEWEGLKCTSKLIYMYFSSDLSYSQEIDMTEEEEDIWLNNCLAVF